MSQRDGIFEAARLLSRAQRVAVLTGAGISAESGIPTFRGQGGLWENHRAEDLATPEAFRRDPSLVWRWYDWRRGICARAEPNPAHKVVAQMEERFADFLLVTQNVDGLHRRAGSRRIVEIHGDIWRARCTKCGVVFPVEEVPLSVVPVPCVECGGLARTHVVWFGESYDPELLALAGRFLSACDVLLVVGTSGMVSVPVSLALSAARSGAEVIDVNPDGSPVGEFARIELRARAGEALPAIWAQVADR